MITSSPTAARGAPPPLRPTSPPLPTLRKISTAPTPTAPDRAALSSSQPRSPPAAARPSPTSPRAANDKEGQGRGDTTKQLPALPQRLRGRSSSQSQASAGPSKDQTPRKKVGSERYLVGLGGFDDSEYRRYLEDRRSTKTGTMPGSKKGAKPSSAAQAFIFGQPREKLAASANPAAEAAAKSATVNPAPRLRAGSLSTAGAVTTASAKRTYPPPVIPQPVFKHEGGRRWLRDPTQVYPLPVDLEELHRQSMQLVLMMRLFAAPFCNTTFLSSAAEGDPPRSEMARGKQKVLATPKGGLSGNPPTPRGRPVQVLEVACGAAVWSSACHDYLARHGHTNVHFTGMDVAPLAPDLGKTGVAWRFVQWDMRQMPWPFDDGEFDFVFLKDVSLIGRAARTTTVPIPEVLRLLRVGGVVEFWESDYVFRTLLSNPQRPPNTSAAEAAQAEACAVYVINASTPFMPPTNSYLADVNTWINEALMQRELSPSPCGLFEWALRAESDRLKAVDSRRLAIPFDHTRWEREAGRMLTPSQAALRRTALLTTMQFICSLEPLLRTSSAKRPDEWSRFWTGMMRDLLENKGASGGECLELGAWWAVRC